MIKNLVPFALNPSSGWQASFYGDLHIDATDGVKLYRRKKHLAVIGGGG